MSQVITASLPYNGNEITIKTAKELTAAGVVKNLFLLSQSDQSKNVEGFEVLQVNSPFSTQSINLINEKSDTPYILLLTQDTLIQLGQFALDRFIEVAKTTGAGLLYSDYFDMKEDIRTPHPVIDYQLGSIRDDFHFGPLLFFRKDSLEKAVKEFSADYKFAGLYDLRLSVSRDSQVLRIPEHLYSIVEVDLRKSGEKLFDYVNPKNREVQIEMEKAATEHLKKINAYLKPEFKSIEEKNGKFEVEASVIIPVKNRVKTIKDAVESVLKQKTDFNFNLIVVDNHSNDGTTEILKSIAEKDKKLIHLVPERTDLGIGGCWNEAAFSKHCGKYAVQLDSDDIYQDENTLQSVVDVFRKEKCAMVVGSYRLTDFNLNDIPPGVIDHKEWTPDNGRNNALRINGLGAPRAFYTPLLREIKIPNVSYGEDYALGLAFSRQYQIGRIYDPIYICRRWEGNSDAALPVEKQNAHNLYKDRIRTLEILARQNLNSGKL